MQSHLIKKYNVPGPRYTSYPTVPYWNDQEFSLKQWKASVRQSFEESNDTQGLSLYIHLPFCESLCTFCGCNKRITKNHSVEKPYIASLIKEWELYIEIFGRRPVITEIHLGGGTPTFFSPENLSFLMNGLFRIAKKSEHLQLSFEGHPNNTSEQHLRTLASLGFTRVSYGVQDYNETVQKAIHRIQPFENVQRATDLARKSGFDSVGHDIIFGLPFQKTEHVIHTIEKTIALMPDRIAFYSYAHTPWIKGNGQRGFSENDLPDASEKRKQYETGKQMLENAGYIEIGMDHFALPTDTLYKAVENKTLHRNFMGYTESKTQLMIGLGVSAISDSWYAFAQNVKNVEEYQALIADGILPVYRGHILNEEDLIIRKQILNLMCNLDTSWEEEIEHIDFNKILNSLQEMENDQLIERYENQIKVTEKGRAFVRNICMAFDLRLQRKSPGRQLFSMTI